MNRHTIEYAESNSKNPCFPEDLDSILSLLWLRYPFLFTKSFWITQQCLETGHDIYPKIHDVQSEDLSILKMCVLSLRSPVHVYQHLRKTYCHQIHKVGGDMVLQDISKHVSDYTVTTQKTAMWITNSSFTIMLSLNVVQSM